MENILVGAGFFVVAVRESIEVGMGSVTRSSGDNSEEAKPSRKRANTITSCHDNKILICNCHSKFSNHDF